MNWISVSSGCIAASNAISKTSPALRSFIREVREARTELDAVLAELHSLDGVLDILKDDASIFPADLAQRTTPLIEHCGSIINQIEGYMHVCNGLGLSQRDKKYRWMAIKGDMEKLRLTLEGYKSTLAVVTDLVGLESHSSKETETMSIDSHSSTYHHAVAQRHATKDDMKDELTRVMGDMGGLRSRLQGEFRAIYAVTSLESCLDAMQRHATDLGYRLQAHDDNKVETAEQQPPRAARAANPEDRHYTHSGSSSVGDAPDSAIDIYDDGPPSPYGRISKDERGSSLIVAIQQGHPETGPDQDFAVNLPTVEIRECAEDGIAEDSEVVPVQVPDPRASTPRAPTPPPKASRRSNSVYSTSLSPFTGGGLRGLPGLGKPHSAPSVSEPDVLDSEGNPVVPQRVSSLRSQANSDDNCKHTDDNSNDDDTRSTLGSLRGIRPPPPGRHDSDFSNFSAYMGGVAVTTTITGGSSAGESSIDESAPPPIKDGRSRASLGRSRLFGRKNSFSVPGVPTRPSTTSSSHLSTTSPTGGGAHVMSAFAEPGDAFVFPPARAYSRPYLSSTPPTPPTPRTPPVPRTPTSTMPRTPRMPVTPTNQMTPSILSKPSMQSMPSMRSIPSTPTTFGGSQAIESAATSITNTPSSNNTKPPRSSSTALSTAGASIRSSGSRLSSMFRKVNLWSPKIPELEAPAEEPEPDDIFGVSLKKSMQMASASVKTHHDGSKGSSRREFPRCVLMCVQFIKKSDGVMAPNIFGGEMMIGLGGSGGNGSGSEGDAAARVASLKESFSTAPHYGEGSIDWSRYTVYDAAELIVLFLQQLRRPLISETVAKRWIVLSKQATLPGSMGMRLDSCIDFWDEALLGVRGAARSLFKLLLNLLGDIADAADVNDMTAERLASRMLNPLMHLSAAKYTTDYMLGLAFLIRKRSEYSAVLRRDGKKSKAAFES